MKKIKYPRVTRVSSIVAHVLTAVICVGASGCMQGLSQVWVSSAWAQAGPITSKPGSQVSYVLRDGPALQQQEEESGLVLGIAARDVGDGWREGELGCREGHTV